MQIRPQETFPIVYQISDPTDTTVYYVRAVLRNSATGTTLRIGNAAYVNLVADSNNSRRFAANIQAPGDPSGLGFWIDVTISVYTDSGYTTKSPVYQEVLDKYVIGERWSITQGGGGGSLGSIDDKLKKAIDYDRIDKTFRTSLEDVVGRIPAPPAPVDLSPIIEGHEDIKRHISATIPKPVPIDLESHSARIVKAITDQIKNIPEVDLTPVLERINGIKIPEPPNLKPHFDESRESLKAEFNALAKLMATVITAVKNQLEQKDYDHLIECLSGRNGGKNPVDSRSRALNLL